MKSGVTEAEGICSDKTAVGVKPRGMFEETEKDVEGGKRERAAEAPVANDAKVVGFVPHLHLSAELRPV